VSHPLLFTLMGILLSVFTSTNAGLPPPFEYSIYFFYSGSCALCPLSNPLRGTNWAGAAGGIDTRHTAVGARMLPAVPLGDHQSRGPSAGGGAGLQAQDNSLDPSHGEIATAVLAGAVVIARQCPSPSAGSPPGLPVAVSHQDMCSPHASLPALFRTIGPLMGSPHDSPCRK
jgi:hypothetical protein